MQDEYRQIPGRSQYGINTSGVIMNLSNGKILKQFLTPLGYIRVPLRPYGITSTLVHRMVAITWLPNPYNLRDVNHINHVKTDNRLENLEWCTRSENIQHSYNAGRRPQATRKPFNSLSLGQQEQILTLLLKGASARKIAKLFDIGRRSPRFLEWVNKQKLCLKKKSCAD